MSSIKASSAHCRAVEVISIAPNSAPADIDPTTVKVSVSGNKWTLYLAAGVLTRNDTSVDVYRIIMTVEPGQSQLSGYIGIIPSSGPPIDSIEAPLESYLLHGETSITCGLYQMKADGWSRVGLYFLNVFDSTLLTESVTSINLYTCAALDGSYTTGTIKSINMTPTSSVPLDFGAYRKDIIDRQVKGRTDSLILFSNSDGLSGDGADYENGSPAPANVVYTPSGLSAVTEAFSMTFRRIPRGRYSRSNTIGAGESALMLMFAPEEDIDFIGEDDIPASEGMWGLVVNRGSELFVIDQDKQMHPMERIKDFTGIVYDPRNPQIAIDGYSNIRLAFVKNGSTVSIFVYQEDELCFLYTGAALEWTPLHAVVVHLHSNSITDYAIEALADGDLHIHTTITSSRALFMAAGIETSTPCPQREVTPSVVTQLLNPNQLQKVVSTDGPVAYSNLFVCNTSDEDISLHMYQTDAAVPGVEDHRTTGYTLAAGESWSRIQYRTLSGENIFIKTSGTANVRTETLTTG